MPSRPLRVCLACLLVLPLSFSFAHQSTPNRAPPRNIPDLRFTGSVVSMAGHELGYLRPEVGSTLDFHFTALATLERIEFDPGNAEVSSYVPIDGRLRIVKMEGGQEDSEWASFRAVAEGNNHRVTLDAVRKPGRGRPDATEVWILIESRDRITGVVEIFGRVSGH